MANLLSPFPPGYALNPEQGGTGFNGDQISQGLLLGGGSDGLTDIELIAGDGIAIDTTVSGRISISGGAAITYGEGLIEVDDTVSIDPDYSGPGHDHTDESTSFGYQTLQSQTSGTGNTAYGYQAAHALSSGSGNTALGSHALYTATSGSFNTGIGYQADVANGAYTKCVAIGFNTVNDKSDQVKLGSSTCVEWVPAGTSQPNLGTSAAPFGLVSCSSLSLNVTTTGDQAARCGITALLAGAATEIPCVGISANAAIFLSYRNSQANQGILVVISVNEGVSFSIGSSNALDDSFVSYLVINPI